MYSNRIHVNGDGMTVSEIVAAYLERVKAAAGARSDAALAAKLEVSKPTISSWRQRASVPHGVQLHIFRMFGVALDSETEATLSKQSDDLRPHLAALLFLVFSARSAEVSFGGAVDTAYWWAKRFPYLSEFFRQELRRRVDSNRSRGIVARLDTQAFPADQDELRRATEQIAQDLSDGRILSMSALEGLPYRGRTS